MVCGVIFSASRDDAKRRASKTDFICFIFGCVVVVLNCYVIDFY